MNLPLAGLKVLVTRPRHQAEALSSLLREAGAVPVEMPVIEVVPVEPADVRTLLGDVSSYDWLVFTSVNTVKVVAPLLATVGSLPRVLAIGNSTASALREFGVPVDLIPEAFVGESLVEALVEQGIAGQRVLLPQAQVARKVLPDGLRAAGATVEVVKVYQTRQAREINPDTLAALQSGLIDVVTFTSPSTVASLLELAGGSILEGIRVACIGPVTERAAQEAGLRVDIVAETYTMPGLVQALVDYEGERDD